VVLGRLAGEEMELLGQTELAGRSYSATLVAAVAELLKQHAVALREIGVITAVNGPGSFTGVRVGLSAVKGLAEPFGIPAAVASRLEVLAGKIGTRGPGVLSAALDAHRREV
jgi:tRNA threonylcarbamoyladenosine biosynthesis protein TsaB